MMPDPGASLAAGMSPAMAAAAMAVLLLSPGPTNTLVALGAATRGGRGALPLVAAAVAAYLMVIVPVALFGRPWIAARPDLAAAVRVVAAAWVVLLAIRLWHWPAAGGALTVGLRAVVVTTCLNPKALVIALALLPAAEPAHLLPWFGLVAACVAAAAAVWAAAGVLLGRHTAGTLPRPLRRVAAGYLGIVAIGLAAGAV